MQSTKDCAKQTCNPFDSLRGDIRKSGLPGNDLWTDGLLCAFELIHGKERHPKHHRGKPRNHSNRLASKNFIDFNEFEGGEELNDEERGKKAVPIGERERPDEVLRSMSKKRKCGSLWVPIGWSRISQLVEMVNTDAEWDCNLQEDLSSYEDDNLSVADVASPYWDHMVGPTWWCHVDASHSFAGYWLASAQWLHPAIRVALKDESRLISDRMKHLYYEVPINVAGGLLFELLGQSVGDSHCNEEDVPIVLRSWQAQNFLVTALHKKGNIKELNVLGIMEVQDLIGAGSPEAPRSVHELIAHLAMRLARWDERLFRKHVFGAADELELKFVNRRGNEELPLLSIILNQEIKRLSTQVIRVKWSLHAREEIIFELSQHLRGKYTMEILDKVRRSTRNMIDEQDSVRDRLFTVQDVMQNTVRVWLQDRSVRVQHNLAVFGGGGLVLSIITGLFGINVDGIPGNASTPYAFALFSGCLVLLGSILIGLGLLYLGLRKPITESQVTARRIELQDLIKAFQRDAEAHTNVHSNTLEHNPESGQFSKLNENDYLVLA